MVDLTIGTDVRLIGTDKPIMKIHRHLEEVGNVECIWFNTLLELQMATFNAVVLQRDQPLPEL